MKVTFEEFIILKKNLKPNTPTRILSDSMAPFIYKDETIFISPINVHDLKTGTPIVFWLDDILICHFFITKLNKNGKDYLITKGLNSHQFDPPLAMSQLLGIVSKPQIGFLKRFLFNLYFRFIIRFKIGPAKSL